MSYITSSVVMTTVEFNQGKLLNFVRICWVLVMKVAWRRPIVVDISWHDWKVRDNWCFFLFTKGNISVLIVISSCIHHVELLFGSYIQHINALVIAEVSLKQFSHNVTLHLSDTCGNGLISWDSACSYVEVVDRESFWLTGWKNGRAASTDSHLTSLGSFFALIRPICSCCCSLASWSCGIGALRPSLFVFASLRRRERNHPASILGFSWHNLPSSTGRLLLKRVARLWLTSGVGYLSFAYSFCITAISDRENFIMICLVVGCVSVSCR